MKQKENEISDGAILELELMPNSNSRIGIDFFMRKGIDFCALTKKNVYIYCINQESPL